MESGLRLHHLPMVRITFPHTKTHVYEEKWEAGLKAASEMVCDHAITLEEQLVERFPHKGL
jgi:hypothetical protein